MSNKWLKTGKYQTHCKGDSHSSKIANITLSGHQVEHMLAGTSKVMLKINVMRVLRECICVLLYLLIIGLCKSTFGCSSFSFLHFHA